MIVALIFNMDGNIRLVFKLLWLMTGLLLTTKTSMYVKQQY